MTREPSAPPRSPRSSPARVTRPLALLICAQATFGVAWSMFLIQPKFLKVVLDASAADIGVITSAAPLAGAASIPLGTALIDRLGRKPLFLLGTLLAMVASLGYLTVDALGPRLFVLQAALGGAFVFAFNAAVTLATDDAPPGRLGRVIGVIGAVNMATNAMGTVLAERLAAYAGWDAVFWLAAALSAVALCLGLALPGRRPDEADRPDVESVWVAARGPMGRILVVSATLGCTFIALFTFIQPHALNLGAENVSSFYVGFTTAAVVMRLGFGGLGDRHGHARVAAAAIVLYSCVTFSATWIEAETLWLYGTVFGLAHGVAYPTLNALAIERAPPSHRGRTIMLYNGLFNVGASLGSYAWGLLAEYAGYQAIFAPAALLGLVALFVLLCERPRQRALSTTD